MKSMKTHLKSIVGYVKLISEELSTIPSQIEACLNSCPLVPMLNIEEDGIEALFLIDRPLESFPDAQSLLLLHRWCLCQALMQHFWIRWSSEYLASLQRLFKSGIV